MKKFVQKKDVANKEYYYTQNPHNGYLSIGVQLGLVGLVFLIMLFIQQWRISNELSLFSNYVAKGMIVTIVVGNLMNSVIYSHTQGLFFVIFTALLFSSFQPNKFQKNQKN